MIDGEQMTIFWHVDDLLIGHKNPDAVTNMIHWLQARYETPDKPLRATCGFKHDYLGMNIDLSISGNISFDMILYINKIIQEFPEKIMGVSPTPAGDHLFKIRDPTDACHLPEPQVIAYHHTVAQLLFLSRVRKDIQTAVAFLTTRVKHPDEDDWGKLKRALKYLKGTRYLKLTLSAVFLFSNDLLMHLIRFMRTVKVTQVHFLHLVWVQLPVHPINKKSIQKALLKQNSSRYMTSPVIFSGQRTS
jgi:hypothetical protein